MEKFVEILNGEVNNIINDLKKNKVKREGTLKNLLWPNLDNEVLFKYGQSLSIKMGHAIEKAYRKYALSKGAHMIDVDTRKGLTKHAKYKVDTDILFIYNDFLHYYESKTDINLDTEKVAATIRKVDMIQSFLSRVSLKYGILYSGEPRININTEKLFQAKRGKKQLPPVNILGYNDFFEIFGEEFDRGCWEEMLKGIGTKLYEAIIQVERG
jgi:hypothetical protein